MLAAMIGFASCANSQVRNERKPQVDMNSLPLALAETEVPVMTSCFDEVLQHELDKMIAANPVWKELVANKKMSVGVVDLRNMDHIRYGAINGDNMMYAASLPKIAVLLASQDAIAKGELAETDEVKEDMRLMISRSNNEATTRMMDRVGFEKIATVMQDPKYNFYDKEHGGGLWVGKRYAADGYRHGDPLKNISHGASVEQVCRFYYMLTFGQLVSRERSAEMLNIMEKPELHHKFVNTLDRIAPNARIFRKSGTWSKYHADSVLVWQNDGKRRYILVALIEDEGGEAMMRELVVPVERAMNNAAAQQTAQLQNP